MKMTNSAVSDYIEALAIEEELTGLALINAMIRAHLAQYCFSSCNVILKKELSLEKKQLFERVITKKQGGYCFEHNKIIYLALVELGFDVRPIIARVLLDGNTNNGRLHRLTLLNYQSQQYIIDVGFGSQSPTCVIKLTRSTDKASSDKPQNGINYLIEPYDTTSFIITKVMADKSQTLYLFDLGRYSEYDCDIGHFYSHQAPTAAFVNHLVVSKTAFNKIYLVRHLEYFEIDISNNTESVVAITDAQHLYRILATTFSLPIKLYEAQLLFDHQMLKAKA